MGVMGVRKKIEKLVFLENDLTGVYELKTSLSIVEY